MLDLLGLDTAAESVYRGILDGPQDVPDLCARLGLSAEEVRDALNRLSAMALVRPSTEDSGRMHAVSPHVGMEILLARQQAELAHQQQRLEESRAAAAQLILEYDGRSDGAAGVRYFDGIDSIRDHLAVLRSRVTDELLTFAPGGPQTLSNMNASRPLNQQLLERGVQMRTVYLDSIRSCPDTMEYAHWLSEQGCQVRTVASLPNRLIIYDRRAAVIAADTGNTAAGAVELTSQGMVATLHVLFESVWQSAEPLEACSRPVPGALNRQQAEALRLLAQGYTDEAIGTRLGVSPRTARRIASGLMDALDAASRFQAGVHAVQRGYLPTTPD
ncbi:helix-turn-helix domain-containing protein [Streptomyces erythrochromogenes]|uniref:helix-turn-helix domain-containing protein n=1 Tax=Streptomyces erythrochromogenes TaxID=285574 RepID=UPI00367DC1ED